MAGQQSPRIEHPVYSPERAVRDLSPSSTYLDGTTMKMAGGAREVHIATYPLPGSQIQSIWRFHLPTRTSYLIGHEMKVTLARLVKLGSRLVTAVVTLAWHVSPLERVPWNSYAGLVCRVVKFLKEAATWTKVNLEPRPLP